MLYFLPGCRSAEVDPANYGLAHALEGAAPLVQLGVEWQGQTGALACQSGCEEWLGWAPERQTWRKSPCGRHWVGWWDDRGKPTPRDLMRPDPRAGRAVTLADGAAWLVPRLYVYQPDQRGFQVGLPASADLDEEGRWVRGPVLAPYRRLQTLAERLFDGLVRVADETLSEAERPRPLNTEEMLDHAAELLAVNYRVGRLELAMLGVLSTDESLWRIARAAIDLDSAEEDLAGEPVASAG